MTAIAGFLVGMMDKPPVPSTVCLNSEFYLQSLIPPRDRLFPGTSETY